MDISSRKSNKYNSNSSNSSNSSSSSSFYNSKKETYVEDGAVTALLGLSNL